MQKEISWLLKEKYSGIPTDNFYKDIKRLNGDEPLAFVIGFTEFLGCKIDLSKKPLIPRPETEYWVSQVITNTLTFSRIRECGTVKILDMFAGSGCIGIAISRHVKKAKVIFADKDKKCLEQIRINLKNNHVRGNVSAHVIQSDVFSNIKGRFDYIFANPPYIPTTRKNKIQKSVLKYEPRSALFGGKDGLFYINKFLREAKKHLRRPASAEASAWGPQIFMEFDYIQKKGIERLLKKYDYKNYEFHKDQYGRYRWVGIV